MQQSITWGNVNPGLCPHVVSLSHNDSKPRDRNLYSSHVRYHGQIPLLPNENTQNAHKLISLREFDNLIRYTQHFDSIYFSQYRLADSWHNPSRADKEFLRNMVKYSHTSRKYYKSLGQLAPCGTCPSVAIPLSWMVLSAPFWLKINLL